MAEQFVRERSAEACRERVERPAVRGPAEEARIGLEQAAEAGFAGLAAGRDDAGRARKFREPALRMTSLRKL